MVSVISRMRKLRAKLLHIRVGPGAAILPSEVSKIQMDFAFKWNDGHLGPRKFWRDCLPRLKYYNPGIPMIINRTEDQEAPAVMTIHFADPAASPDVKLIESTETPSDTTADPTALVTSRTEVINMKNKHSSDILTQLLAVTKATPVEATAEDIELGRQLKIQQEKSEEDRIRRQEVNAAIKREKDMLNQARGEIEASRAA